MPKKDDITQRDNLKSEGSKVTTNPVASPHTDLTLPVQETGLMSNPPTGPAMFQRQLTPGNALAFQNMVGNHHVANLVAQRQASLQRSGEAIPPGSQDVQAPQADSAPRVETYETVRGTITLYDRDGILGAQWKDNLAKADYLVNFVKIAWQQNGEEKSAWLADSAQAIGNSSYGELKATPGIEVKPIIENGYLTLIMDVSFGVAGPKVTDTYEASVSAEANITGKVAGDLGLIPGMPSVNGEASIGNKVGASLKAGRSIQQQNGEIKLGRKFKIVSNHHAGVATIWHDGDADIDPPESVQISGFQDNIFAEAGGRLEIASDIEGDLFTGQYQISS